MSLEVMGKSFGISCHLPQEQCIFHLGTCRFFSHIAAFDLVIIFCDAFCLVSHDYGS